jgi:uncharacterized protein (TIGR02001 family)
MKTIAALGLAGCVALGALPSLAQAQDGGLSFNVGLTSDYRYRGISQTRFKPALQAGVDYALPGGFYVGAWGSTIKWIKDAGKIAGVDTGNANVELDIYGGYKGEVQPGVSYDVGVLTYVYPGNKLSRIPGAKNANTTEIYGALTVGMATLKYSNSVTSLFGTATRAANSKNSGYLDLSGTLELGPGLTLVPHIGYQRVAKFSDLSYVDYSLTLAKDWDGLVVSGAIVAANVKNVGGAPVYASPSGKDLGRTGFVLTVKKNF